MTDATITDVDELSRRIAARGRVALVERLRTAYRAAAEAHSDIVSLESERLEALVQNAADHADGLQWRRALAGLVADELGVSVAEALSHPAVIRAQSIVGAPSYEQSLAELITRPIPPPLPTRGYDPDDPDLPPTPIAGQMRLEDERAHQPEDVPSEELEAAIADDTVIELLPSPDPWLEGESPTQSYEITVYQAPDFTDREHRQEPAGERDAVTDADVVETGVEADSTASTGTAAEATVEPTVEPAASETNPSSDQPSAQSGTPDADAVEGVGELRVPAIHLGGVANLPTGNDGIDLRLSDQGLDILRGADTIIGRLPWGEIEALEVPGQKRRRRGGATGAKLVVRTRQGDASFEIPGFTSDELRDRVELRIDRYRPVQS